MRGDERAARTAVLNLAWQRLAKLPHLLQAIIGIILIQTVEVLALGAGSLITGRLWPEMQSLGSRSRLGYAIGYLLLIAMLLYLAGRLSHLSQPARFLVAIVNFGIILSSTGPSTPDALAIANAIGALFVIFGLVLAPSIWRLFANHGG